MPRSPPNKITLNDLNIKSQKPKDRPFLVWDKKQRGLALCVQPSGHLSFKCIYSRRGQPRWYHLGHVDIGVAKARIAARKILVQVDDGKDPQANKKAERSIGTFAELAALYRDHAKKVNKSWQQADNLVTRYVLPRWGKLQRDNISRSDVVSMLAKIDAPILANQVLASASAIFTWAIKQELGVTINPCSKVDRNETNERERILSDGEIPKFWTAFDNVGQVEGLALRAVLLTGQRPIEVSHMRTEHIEDGWWTLPGKPEPKLNWPGTKNSKTHYVYLPKAAQQIIEQLGSTGMIFAGARGVPVSGLDKDMRAICPAAED
jgi:integrase